MSASFYAKWKRRLRRAARWMLRRSNVATFFVLCADDPVTCTLYFREGKYNGLKKRDWGIFLAATVVSNIYWIIGIAVALRIAAWLWGLW